MANLTDLIQRQDVWRGGALAAPVLPAVPTGFEALDRELPGGGWPTGALTEVFCGEEGIGELQLVLPALAALTAAGRRVAWLAPPYLPYAPALRAAGVRLEHLTVVRAPGRRDALWAAEQVLRARACHGLLAWLPRAAYPELRRLAVGVQGSPGFALVFRPQSAACESSPATLRLELEPLPGAGGPLSVRILKRRGAPMAAPLRFPVPRPAMRPLMQRPAHALGRAPFPPASSPGAVARACAA
jgi:hypothetical protein